jgi:hypothetical protein
LASLVPALISDILRMLDTIANNKGSSAQFWFGG